MANTNHVQPDLPGMPVPGAPDPPSLKHMAELMRTVDKLIPADTNGAIGQWERFIEISATVFGNSVQFYIPLIDQHHAPADTDKVD